MLNPQTTNNIGHFGAKNWEEGVQECKPNLTLSGRDMGLSYAKEIVSTSFEV